MQIPDGIDQENVRSIGRRASTLPLLVLGTLLGSGMAGLFGGHPAKNWHAESSSAAIDVQTPSVLRNGLFFETIVEVRPLRSASDLTIAISDSLWRQMTINTMMPQSEKEEFRAGFRRFSFGKAQAGETLRFKIDGQINPSLFGSVAGKIAAYDGRSSLVEVPVKIKVLP